ncbi:uncharacterized protein LOC141720943 isoform X2 [Apium graveolens]|uniref:uncharacterized protein LOC141720943 isoform X2 n=1 Tax=Apium graveolens TaxID=4045 RepID=UPI003D7B5594
MDKLSALTQGLLIVLEEESQSALCFVVPQPAFGGVSTATRTKIPVSKHIEDIKDMIEELSEGNKEEQHEVDTPASPASPPLRALPLPSSALHALIQFLRVHNIPLEIPRAFAFAGIGVVIGLTWMVLAEPANVCAFSKGHEACLITKVTNNFRMTALYLNLNDFELHLLQIFVNALNMKWLSRIDVRENFCTWMSTFTGKPFVMCLSSGDMLSIAFRGHQTCIVVGAAFNIDGISPVYLGSMAAQTGNYRKGNFQTTNMEFVIIGSVVLLEAL